MEEEKDGKLAFLDVQAQTGLTTSIYQKPTHTDRYIPFHSYLHQRTTTGVLRCMHDRALHICSSTSRETELERSSQWLPRRPGKKDTHISTYSILHTWARTGTNEDTRHSLHLWIEWKTWKGVHFTWCTCSLQTSKDTQAYTNDTERHVCQMREREEVCMKSHVRNARRPMLEKWRERWGSDLENTNKQWRRATPRMELQYMLMRPSMKLIGKEQKWRRWKPITGRGGPLKPSKSKPAVKQWTYTAVCSAPQYETHSEPTLGLHNPTTTLILSYPSLLNLYPNLYA